jgi:exodeoxyribonuclease VII small subunit
MNPSKKKVGSKKTAAGTKGRGGRAKPGAGGGEELSFEAALERLEAIVGRLEDGEIPLEESIEAYAEGTRLVHHCLEKLDRAETMIRELSEKAEGFRLDSSSLEEEDDAFAEDDEDDDEDPSDELPF